MKRTVKITNMEKLIERFNKIIDNVESRCMAVDGPVTPTLQEMTEDELSEVWKILQEIRSNLSIIKERRERIKELQIQIDILNNKFAVI